MQEQMISSALLEKKSKETGLVFSDLLGAAVLEETVRRIAASAQGEMFWLRNGTVLGKRRYKEKLSLHLEYDYAVSEEVRDRAPDAELLLEAAGLLRDQVFAGAEDYGVIFFQKEAVRKNCLQLQLSAEVEDMRVPVSVCVYVLHAEKKMPKTEQMESILFPELILTYHCHPAEGLLAEQFTEIMSKLELISDMGAYYEVYRLLEKDGIDGRKVRECMEEQCQKRGLNKDYGRIDLIAGYQEYSYMKKKWKAFLRSAGSREPMWEQAVDRFLKFFGPIWRAVADDAVFFGDWMPELNRFL